MNSDNANGRRISVSITCAACLGMADKWEIEYIMGVMLAAARQHPIGDVEVALVDDARIAYLNEHFLGCKGPTNIITFPGDGEMPGMLFVSMDCLARECLFYRQGRLAHFIRLLAHGIGHLAGLDHGREMAKIEFECLNAYKASNQRPSNDICRH